MISIQAEGGVEITCLPDVAWCRCENKNIEDVEECPMRYFHPAGDICRPDLCEYYTEEPDDIIKDEEGASV